MTPTSATALTLYFESVYNDYNGAEATALVNDTVVLTVTAGKMKQAMQAIAAAMTSNKLYQDGTIVIAEADNGVYYGDIATISSDSGFAVAVTLDS